MPRAPSRLSARDAGAVVAVLALMGVVAVAASGTPLSSLVQQGGADRLQVLTDVGILLGIGAFVSVVGVVLYHHVVVARRGDTPFRATLLRAAPALTVILVAFSLLVMAGTDLNAGAGGPPEEAFGGFMPGADRPGRPLEVVGWWAFQVLAGEGAPDREIGPGGAQSGLHLPPLVIAALILALALAAMAVWRRFRRTAVSLPDTEDEAEALEAERRAMHGAVVGSIDAMLADPDPRTAIIGAYARLLEHLAASGAGRREPEAPLEHLRRVLTMLRVRPDPLRELIELFELARFSTHPLAGSHRDRALDALGAVARDLESAPAAVAPMQPGSAAP